ncbi:MAG: hypothetical protein V9E89_03635 [Ilumatobacteraceae bacterium]
MRDHRQAIFGRRLDHADVAHAGQPHVERARDRRGRQRQDVHLRAQLLEMFLVLDAEALFLVDDHQAEVLELSHRPECRRCVPMMMSISPLSKLLDARDLLLAGVRKRESMSTLIGKAARRLAEGLVVLLREDRRRHQHGHLLAVIDRLERRPQRDFGFAVADIAADQAIHRVRLFHVRLDITHRAQLIFRLHIRERSFQFVLPGRIRARTAWPGALRAWRIQSEQFARFVLDRLLRPALDADPVLPGRAC